MHFAVVGDLAEAIFIVHAIHASDQHRLATCCVTEGLAREIAARSIPVSLSSSPEEALLDEQAETVVVSYADSETAIHMARQVSQADRHVLVVPPLDASTAFSYELHLLLDESQYSIIPLSGRWYLDPTSVATSFPGGRLASDHSRRKIGRILPVRSSADSRHRRVLRLRTGV